MCCTTRTCYTCLENTDSEHLLDLNETDGDKLSYFEKLKLCLGAEPQDSHLHELCRTCVIHLEDAYQFITRVRDSQSRLCEYKAEQYGDYPENKLELESKPELHVAEELKPESYDCDVCTAKFSKRWQLRKHQQRLHVAERPHACDHCGKTFKQAYHLTEHVRSHAPDRLYQCTYCDKKFHRASSQRRHLRSHTAPPGEKTKRTPFLCTVCGKSFPFRNGVQRHMRVHLGVRTHECDVCHRRFNQSTHLRTHMRTHTGEKPYVCEGCGLAFSLNCSLQKHMAVAHKGDEVKTEFKVIVDVNAT